tara:strand:- start:7636 stop:8193 length:558 start_codon:yes stop_codon:yes gene_type:complete
MIDNIKKESDQKMKKSIESLKANLSKIRTGRAHPSIIEGIKVDYYGNETPLSQVSSIKVEDARTLLIVVWEKDMVNTIEKAIMNSDLGLNPAVAGTNIRIPMPPLTEERRMDFIKLVKSEVEQTRVAIRNIRRDANSKIKEILKKKEISEDDEKQANEYIQKITDSHIGDAENILKDKESDLMQV